MQPMTSRISRRRLIAAVSLSAVGAVALAACGAPAAPPPPTASTSAAPTTAPPPTAAAAPTTAPPPTTAPVVAPTTAPATMAPATPTPAVQAVTDRATDQSLRITGFGQPTTLEPAQEGGSLRCMTQNVWRPLFYLNEKGELLPGVCNKWEVSEDGLKYTFHVDPQAKFSDGSPITASDIKKSYEHSADPALKTWTQPYLSAPILGAQDVVDGKTKEMKGIVAKDDQTVEMTLTSPYTPFIKNTANYIGGIIKASDAAKGDGWEAKALSSGPYVVDSWNRDSGEVSWVVNKNWWGEKPVIQKVTYKYIKDANTQSIAYENNETDVFLPSDILSTELRKGPHAKELHLIPYGGEYYFYFMLDRKPMDDPQVRLAFLKATDMGTAVNAVFQGGQSPAFGIISPNLDCYTNPKTYFDPDGAKAALAASTYKSAAGLPPITFAVRTNLPEYIHVAEALQQMWKQNLGVDVTIHQIDQATDPVRNSAQIMRDSLGTLIYDPSAAASAMGLSQNIIVNGYAPKGWQDKDLDGLLNKADSLPLTQESDRCKLYQQAEQMIMNKAYFMPIIWVQYYYAVKPWVMNYASNIDLSLYPLAGSPAMYIAKH
jgi:ABC-type oligopeptide transport system substrate-binding subunit